MKIARSTLRESDIGNSERLVALHGRDLLHVGSWARWLEWNGSRWAEDTAGGAMRCAIDTARVLLSEAGAELNAATERYTSDPSDASAKKKKAAEKFFAHAAKSQDQRRIQSMLALARADQHVAITHEKLDANEWLLNVANGTLDLRSGELRAHRREDLITKISPVVFNAKATCPIWDAFLLRAMGDDVELVAYVRRVFGYALTGSTREHVLGFFFGGGANGKSTALGALHAIMGDYASPAPRGLLFRSRGERHPTELASLHGKRFVTCAEVEEGQAFEEALVKDLTGGDPIAARRMNEDFWTFTPTHKLFIAGNHKPTVRGDDEGIWRRMRLVPWTVTIPEAERDKSLPEKLRTEFPGILAWCVRGCLEWQKIGLGDPIAVTDATREYRTESDVVGEFFARHLVFAPTERIARKVLRKAYEQWCEDNGHEPLGARRFAGRLRERGVRDANVRDEVTKLTVDGWAGVRRVTMEERALQSWGRGDIVGTTSRLVAPARAPVEDQPGSGPHEVPTSPHDDADERAAIEAYT